MLIYLKCARKTQIITEIKKSKPSPFMGCGVKGYRLKVKGLKVKADASTPTRQP